MILVSQDYKDIHSIGKVEEWIELINRDQQYCTNLTREQVFEFEKYCKPSDLPSYHPYWSYQTYLSLIKYRDELVNKYHLCKDNSDLIKIYFQASTDLLEIEKRIIRRTKDIEESKWHKYER